VVLTLEVRVDLAARPTAPTNHLTEIDEPIGYDRLPSLRGTGLMTVLTVSAALVGGGAVIDEGTRIVKRTDYRPVIEGTSLRSVQVEGPITPIQAPTRMAQTRALAPLSLRDWATVFGVSHSAIKQWADSEEPSREKLDRVLGALTDASAHQAHLAGEKGARRPGPVASRYR
jgi:hypothetical protein